MTEIRMHGEMRTDYDCEATGLPAERWGLLMPAAVALALLLILAIVFVRMTS